MLDSRKPKRRYSDYLGYALATVLLGGLAVLFVAFVIWAVRHLVG